MATAKLTQYNIQAVSRVSYTAPFNMFYRPSHSRRRDKTLFVIRMLLVQSEPLFLMQTINPYESATIDTSTRSTPSLLGLGFSITLYALAAWLASAVGLATLVGRSSVLAVWSMQPVSGHAIQTMIFVAGGVGSLVVTQLIIRNASTIQQLATAVIGGIAFGYAPYLTEVLVNRVPASMIADAAERWDAVPVVATSAIYFVAANVPIVAITSLGKLIGSHCPRSSRT
ncbi:MAG: hypothetical protein WBD31_02760 [Rubripirellula sp.]